MADEPYVPHMFARHPDGTPRWTFSHTEMVEHFTTNRGFTPEKCSDYATMMVSTGAWDVSMDSDNETWYTVKEGYRAGD